MSDSFFDNLQAVTENISDIAFTRYATITNLNSDGTCTAKEDEEEGLTHENINTLGNNLRVGDKVVLGFVDNSIYNPVILTGGEEAYTKTEVDALISGASPTGTISIEDTDLFDVLQCVIDNFDNFGIEYLFYDDCTSVDGLSSYGNGLSLRYNATTTLSYDSTMNAYQVTNSAQGCGMIPITVLNGKNNFKFEFDLYSNTGDKGLGFAMKNTSSNDFHYLGFSCYLGQNVFWSNNNETIFGDTISKTTWHHIIITVTSSTITYDIDNGSQTGSFSNYISMDNNVVIGIESQGISGDSGYVKNIKVESL